MKIRPWVDEFLDGTNLLIEPYNAECKKLCVYVSKQLAAMWQKCIERARLAQRIMI